MAQLTTPALVTDPQGVVTWASPAFRALLGVEAASLLGAPATAFLNDPIDAPGENTERYVTRGDGDRRLWLHCSTSRWTDPGGEIHTLRCFTDLTEFESRNRGRAAALSGRDVSRLDDATGSLNRLTILQELEAEIARSRRYGNALGAILVCLTDEPAHTEPADPARADAEMRAVLLRVNNSLRWVDLVGRVSDRELLVLLPETDQGGARRVQLKIEQDAEAGNPGIELTALGWNGSDSTEDFLDRLRAVDTSVPSAAA